jgi:hypothetical protein
MGDITKTSQLPILPGVKRDGTDLDSQHYSDAQWVRFQRGRPRKMGGYRQITNQLAGPIRNVLVWSRSSLNALYMFSVFGIEMLLVDQNGLGASTTNRTPVGFTPNDDYVWSSATQYDDAVGSQGTVVLAHAATSLTNIDDATGFQPYLGLANGTGVFTVITDAPSVSGGIFSIPPYTVCHGSDGQVEWSDANQPQVWRTSAGNIGDAGADRVTGAKIVKGMQLRSGSGPAALLWSLDSVIRMDWVGGSAIFRFTHISSQSSILSQSSVIEYDGVYYWAGIDRFMTCDGNRTAELPNNMNLNWFYDNLNYAARQKVWVTKNSKFGEIIWHFPFGDAEECSHCVIYNVREQVWYDNQITRGAGYFPQVFRYPVLTDSLPNALVILTLSAIAGTISVGDSVTGVSSGVSGLVEQISGSNYYVSGMVEDFIVGEGLVDNTSGATATISDTFNTYSAYAHEVGTDRVILDNQTAIESYVQTSNFGYATGGVQSQVEGEDVWTRIVRIEPDFVQSGEMTVEVIGQRFANSEVTVGDVLVFDDTTEYVDMQTQERIISLKFSSNVAGGDFQMGRVLVHIGPGDNRN